MMQLYFDKLLLSRADPRGLKVSLNNFPFLIYFATLSKWHYVLYKHAARQLDCYEGKA